MRNELSGVAEDSAQRRGPWSRLGLRAAALVLLATSIPVASLIWATEVAKTEVAHRAFGGLTATAKATVLQEQQAWGDALRVVTTDALGPALVSALAGQDPQLALRAAQNLLSSGPFATVRIVDATGRLWASAGLPGVTPTGMALPGRPLSIGEPLTAGARTSRQVAAAVAGTGGSAGLGWLVVDVDVTQLLGRPSDLAFAHTGTKFLVTRAGTVVAGSAAVGTVLQAPENRAVAAAGQAATRLVYSPFFGGQTAESYEPIPGQGMGILIQQSAEELLGGADHLAALLMAVALALGLLGLGIATPLGIVVCRRTRRVVLSEQALARSETDARRRLEQFMDAMPIGVFVATPDGHPFYLNRAAEELLGQSVVPEAGIDELAQLYRAYVAGTDSLYPASKMPLVRALAAEASHVDDMEISRPEGRVPVEVWGTPVMHPGGSVEFAITAFADVSQRRRSAEELQLLGAITANMADGVALIRLTDGTIVYVNASLESMFGYASGEMVGMPIHELNAPNGTTPEETARAITAAVVAEGSWQGEILSARKDGSSFWSAINVSMFDHPALGPVSISVHTDITTRKAAQDAQAKLAAIVEASRDAIMEKSLDGVIRTWNLGAEHLFGYRASEMIGRSVDMLIPEGSMGDEVQRRGWAAQGLGVEQFETVRICKDGTVVDVSVTLSPIPGPNGRITGIATICRDVTERKRAEAKFEGLLDSAPDAIVVVGGDGRIRLVNRQTEVLFGYSRAELVGQPVECLIPDRLDHPEQRDRFFADPSARAMGAGLELAARRKDGSEFPVDISLSPLQTEEGVLVSAAVRDVTDRKRAQAALLEREGQLAAARDEALEASRLKSQFLANMSHEIRTPMNGVLGMAHLVLAGNLEPEQRSRIAKLVQSGQGLLTIINDILDFSKVEAGMLMLEAEDFNLVRAVETIVGLLASAANAKGLTLELTVGDGVPEWVNGDSVRIQQTLTNILGNAIKFTERGGIELTVTQTVMGPLRFEVHDTGIGIDPSLKARLLEPFTQADTSTTRRFGGTGLGLAICRQLVSLMGGELDFTSQPGVGTTFWFEVELPAPAQRPPATGGAYAPIPNPGPPPYVMAGPEGGGRILLVDDSDINRDVGKGLLESVGYPVDAVGSGAAAVEAVGTGSYAAVLMDCLMPTMDGYEATSQIRAMEGTARHTRVIALTAAAMSGDRERCLAAGMDDYVSKPFELKTLVEALARGGLGLATTAAGAGDAVTGPSIAGVPEGGSGLLARLQFLASAMPPEHFDRICEQFLSATPAIMGDLAAALSEEDIDAVRAHAHKLRGSMATFGAGRLSYLAGRVEAGATRGGGALKGLLSEMGQEFGRARAVVTEVLSERHRS